MHRFSWFDDVNLNLKYNHFDKNNLTLFDFEFDVCYY